jgi:nucleotide-binding universal stress UspA family protein
MTPDIKRILVPVDFSPSARLALDYAYRLAQKFEADLHLVHVCEVPSMLTGSMDSYAIAYTDWSQQLGDEAERQLEQLRPALAAVPVTTEVLFGNPARAIVTAAGTNAADLIVMGTHGHGPFMHVVMGNVAARSANRRTRRGRSRKRRAARRRCPPSRRSRCRCCWRRRRWRRPLK